MLGTPEQRPALFHLLNQAAGLWWPWPWMASAVYEGHGCPSARTVSLPPLIPCSLTSVILPNCLLWLVGKYETGRSCQRCLYPFPRPSFSTVSFPFGGLTGKMELK